MKRYLDWHRRAARSEYWGVLIISWILALVLSMLVIGVAIFDGIFVILALLMLILGLVTLIWAMLATTASRCRDAGINPWWTAATVIPYIGFVVMIVVGCLNTQATQPQ